VTQNSNQFLRNQFVTLNSLSLHLQLPDVHQGPILLPASPGEHLKRAQQTEMEISCSECYWADRLAVFTFWSWAAQLHTSSFHCDTIFDILFETLNSFNAISQHNDSIKAIPLAFNLTTKGKVERGRKQSLIILTHSLLAQ